MKGLMVPNVEAINELIRDRFDNDYRNLAKEIDVDPTTVYRAITGRTKGGTKLFTGLMSYCKKNGLSFDKFIFLPDSLLKSNENKPKPKAG